MKHLFRQLDCPPGCLRKSSVKWQRNWIKTLIDEYNKVRKPKYYWESKLYFNDFFLNVLPLFHCFEDIGKW